MHTPDELVANRPLRHAMVGRQVDDREPGRVAEPGHVTGPGPAWAAQPRDRAQAVAMCDGVIDLMSALFTTSGRQLRAPGRSTRAVARVRQIGMYVAHVTLGLRMVEIAAGFGRDKSTVVHACHLIEDLRDDEEFNVVVAKAEEVTRDRLYIDALETVLSRTSKIMVTADNGNNLMLLPLDRLGRGSDTAGAAGSSESVRTIADAILREMDNRLPNNRVRDTR